VVCDRPNAHRDFWFLFPDPAAKNFVCPTESQCNKSNSSRVSDDIPPFPIAMRSWTSGKATSDLIEWLEEEIAFRASMSVPVLGIASDGG
jgi:hypothetical protein